MKVFVLVITDEDEDHEIALIEAHSTLEKARRSVIDWVAGSPIDPTGDDQFTGDECPEDWYLEPTAFDVASRAMTTGSGYTFQIEECEVDAE